MRAAIIGSLAVLALSTAAITSVNAEGQRTRHHRSGDAASNSMNSTDMTTNTPMPPDMTMPMSNGSSAPGGSTINNGM
jgi:hypothetical protein